MRGIMGTEEGMFVPYKEFHKKLGLPEEYFVVSINSYLKYVYIELMKKESYKKKSGMISVPNRLEDNMSIIIDTGKFKKVLGIDFETFNGDIYLLSKGKALTLFRAKVIYPLLDTGELHVWIGKDNYRRASHFIEE